MKADAPKPEYRPGRRTHTYERSEHQPKQSNDEHAEDGGEVPMADEFVEFIHEDPVEEKDPEPFGGIGDVWKLL